MDLYEHQARQLFEEHGILVPRAEVTDSPGRARGIARALGGRVVVKAQVRTGGRGKAGGVRLAEDPDAAERAAREILGMTIKGHPVRTVMLAQPVGIEDEFYVSYVLDRAAGLPPRTADVLVRLWQVLMREDALLVEVNPLVRTAQGQIMALDGKVTLDDNARFRQARWEVEAASPDDPLEAAAAARGLNYVKLDGEVGVIGNGAGLVMSTLDVVAGSGARPANFLDIGGGASARIMSDGLSVVLSDPDVRSVLVNVFGGITACDAVADGIVRALDAVRPTKPLVVRLDGNNAARGRAVLAERAHPLVHQAATMDDAARLAARLAHIS
ncbi:ATP-grasp domain-containing protein [Streptomyces sp. NPDC058398]|uniref:ATP-grasp domain-containing protein n=1 Tax=Streptomyces sp. NPDC058398 TaxID=3346479 RepID=UPI0036516023